MQLCCQFTRSTNGQSTVHYKVSCPLHKSLLGQKIRAPVGTRPGLASPMTHASRLTWFRWDLAKLLFILTYVNGKILNEKLIIISAVFTNFGEGSAWIRQSHLHASSILWEIYYRECENSVSPLCSKYSNFNGEREKKRRLQFRISDSSIAYSPWRCLINPAFDPRNAFIRCYHLPLSTNMNQVYWVKNIWESYACTVIESQYLQFS